MRFVGHGTLHLAPCRGRHLPLPHDIADFSCRQPSVTAIVLPCCAAIHSRRGLENGGRAWGAPRAQSGWGIVSSRRANAGFAYGLAGIFAKTPWPGFEPIGRKAARCTGVDAHYFKTSERGQG